MPFVKTTEIQEKKSHQKLYITKTTNIHVMSKYVAGVIYSNIWWMRFTSFIDALNTMKDTIKKQYLTNSNTTSTIFLSMHEKLFSTFQQVTLIEVVDDIQQPQKNGNYRVYGMKYLYNNKDDDFDSTIDAFKLIIKSEPFIQALLNVLDGQYPNVAANNSLKTTASIGWSYYKRCDMEIVENCPLSTLILHNDTMHTATQIRSDSKNLWPTDFIKTLFNTNMIPEEAHVEAKDYLNKF